MGVGMKCVRRPIRELVLPQKIERDKRGCYIGCELRRVYLVKEDFFLVCHSAISFVVLRPRQKILGALAEASNH
jgi:hypothetical protein